MPSRPVSSIIDTIDHALESAGDISCDAMRWRPEPEHDGTVMVAVLPPERPIQPGDTITGAHWAQPPRQPGVTILQLVRQYHACPPHRRPHARWVISPAARASLVTTSGGGLGQLWQLGHGQEWQASFGEGEAYLLGLPMEVDPRLPGLMVLLLSKDPVTSATYAYDPGPPATMR